MKHLEVKFNLRHPFEELAQIFAIFNNMILDGNKCEIFLETDKNENQYLHIELHQRKKTFASIEITRLLKDQGEFSQLLLNRVDLINAEDFYPHFSVDESFSEVTIAVYDEKYEEVLIPEIEVFPHEGKGDITNLEFTLRKHFKELPDLISAANHMLMSNYSIYAVIETAPKHMDCSYLSFKIMYKNVWRPSLCINVRFSNIINIKEKYRLDFSKFNYICQTNPRVCPTWFSIVESQSKYRGPALSIHLGEPDDENALKRIYEQCRLIFPE